MMKLFCCAKCNQIFNLTHWYQECEGEHGGGQYIDHVNAKVWGDPTRIFVLGFANTSFINALRDQIHIGDQRLESTFERHMTPRGREFTAFVIPEVSPSVIRVLERFEPVESATISNKEKP